MYSIPLDIASRHGAFPRPALVPKKSPPPFGLAPRQSGTSELRRLHALRYIGRHGTAVAQAAGQSILGSKKMKKTTHALMTLGALALLTTLTSACHSTVYYDGGYSDIYDEEGDESWNTGGGGWYDDGSGGWNNNTGGGWNSNTGGGWNNNGGWNNSGSCNIDCGWGDGAASTEDGESRDLIGEMALHEEHQIVAAGKKFADRYALSADTGIQIARTLDQWAALGKKRARTEADVADFSRRLYGVSVDKAQTALSKAKAGDKSALLETTEDVATHWGTTPETARTILKSWYKNELKKFSVTE